MGDNDLCAVALEHLPPCLHEEHTQFPCVEAVCTEDSDDVLMRAQERRKQLLCPPAVIHNIVSTSLIQASCTPINLSNLAMLLPCSCYDRRKFAAITIRIDNPKCTALLFTSGKLVVTGVKSWYECLLAAIMVSRLLQRVLLGNSYAIVNCDVQNIVAHTELQLVSGQCLNIQTMYENLAMECTYQPTMFPGLIYRPINAPVVLLLFYSGKIVLTGGKTVNDISGGWQSLWPIVKQYVY